MRASTLSRLGLLLTFLINLLPVRPASAALPPDPWVAEMIAQVQPQALVAYTGSLSGEWPAWVNDAPYFIQSRSTNSGASIQNAAQYVYSHLEAWGLSPEYAPWARSIYSGQNVVGTLPGSTTPNEIVLVTAHLDDAPWTNRAPGADDNASGSMGVLLAAEILSQYRFEHTLRFVFFTGEELGLWGSHQYAVDAEARGDNIVAVLNLDMIGWDSFGGPVARLHTRSGSAEDTVIAQAFIDVVSAYGLALQPVLDPDGMSASDHASFWQQGYPAILAIEDDQDDFNRYYHTSLDKLNQFNLEYYSAFVKAAVGTAAHLARPLGKISRVYNARLEPPAAMQWIEPAGSVTYTLSITNTGSLSDSYTLAVANGTWSTVFPASVGPISPGGSETFSVTVSNPPGGVADIAMLRLTSTGAAALIDAAELTSMTHWKRLYLPLLQRSFP